MEDKSPLKGAWSVSRDLFQFWNPNDISVKTEAKIVKFCIHVDVSSPSFRMTNRP